MLILVKTTSVVSKWRQEIVENTGIPICHELARQGRKVYFATCDLMVQELLRAKQELVLDKMLKKMGRYGRYPL